MSLKGYHKKKSSQVQFEKKKSYQVLKLFNLIFPELSNKILLHSSKFPTYSVLVSLIIDHEGSDFTRNIFAENYEEVENLFLILDLKIL